ncbi:unnamed protein product, partial [Phaeothamnion confervicola]
GGPAPPKQGWRVKVYELNSEGQWDDKGTGHIQCRVVEALGGPALCVSSEADDSRQLVCSRVIDGDVYQRQGDNIITWSDPGAGSADAGGADLALSFQENDGCLDIWGRICDVQGRFSS